MCLAHDRGTLRIGTVPSVDLNSIVSAVLFGLIALAIVVRRRAKRADRKRDEREAHERQQAGDGNSLY